MRSLTVFLGTVLYLLLSTLAWADDTDIYLHNPNLDSSVKPNVLFILDNSGSMQYSTGGSYYPAADDQSRMTVMQDAFADIMKNSSNLNVGLMKLWARNNETSRLTFPVTDMDQPLSGNTIIDGNPEIEQSGDDAYELIGSTSNGLMSLDSVTLNLGSNKSVADSLYAQSSTITANKDNAEGLNAEGSFWFNGSQMNFDDGQLNALYFRGLNIPENAIIEAAYITFVSINNENNNSEIRISAELNKNPLEFDAQNFSTRTKTGSDITWSPESWQSNTEYETIDISALIQEILDDSNLNWSNGETLNNLSLFFQTIRGERNAYKIRTDGSQANRAARIDIQYRVASDFDLKYYTGLRFQPLAIPQGASISSASIEFTASANESNETNLEIWAGVPGSTHNNTFTTTTNNISSRAKLGPLLWNPGPWSLGNIEDPNRYSVNVTPLLQQVVNHSDWCGNNATTFHVKPIATNTGFRSAHSFDGNRALRPRLRVEYTGGAGGCKNTIIETRIQDTESDSFEGSGGGVKELWENRLRGNGNTSRTVLSLHYADLPIKKNAQILEASLELTAYENSRNGQSTIKIQAHDIANSSPVPAIPGELRRRVKTSEYINWDQGDWEEGKSYKSPDFKDVIQYLINKDDWTPGNNLSLILESFNGWRAAISYDNNPTLSPKIRLKIADGGIDYEGLYQVKDHLTSLVRDMVPGGGTPVTSTYYEAADYFKNGKDGNSSPISNVCQSNHVVLLTDGQANNYSSTTISAIKSLTGNNQCESDATSSGEKCSRSLATWLGNSDLSVLDGTQNVKTHTIGFALGNNTSIKNFLEDVAENGEGNFYTADKAKDLSKAFNTIIATIIEDEATFVSPGVTANQFNNTKHLSQIYYSVFKPSKSDRWKGNLKRYQLNGDPVDIYDKRDPPALAVDPETGFFHKESRSFWNSNNNKIDGRSVDIGGVGDNLPAAGVRKIFTYIGDNPSGVSVNLDIPEHLLHKDNTLITTETLNLPSSETQRRDDLLDWIRNPATWLGDPLHSVPGLATYRCNNQNADTPYTCPENNQELAIFFGTNDGLFHAVNASDGVEKFAFMPQDLLGNLDKLNEGQATNRLAGETRPYGLDGTVTLWVNDVNQNNVLFGGYDTLDADTSSDFLSGLNPDEFILAYIGMRRGGRNYYALDVTDLDSPKLKWFIEGGSTGFERLGQTWSSPEKTKIRLGNTDRDVLIFSGGYDPDQDQATRYQEDTMGNAVYMVDALTGELIWSASRAAFNGQASPSLTLNKMKYSIPGGVNVIDFEGDGYADQMLFADVGGQVWRLYINNCLLNDPTECAVTSSSDVSNLVWPMDSDNNGEWDSDDGVFASVGPTLSQQTGDHTESEQSRKFFVKPDTSLFRFNGTVHMAVAIGTGNRPSPLNLVVQDRAYVIATPEYKNPVITGSTVTDKAVPRHSMLTHQGGQLINITNRDKSDGADTANPEDIFGDSTSDTRKGWYLDLNNGEKVMTESLTFKNTLYFNTYYPSSQAVLNCNPVPGDARAYSVDLLTGNSVSDSRYITLKNSGIPAKTVVLFVDSSAIPPENDGPGSDPDDGSGSDPDDGTGDDDPTPGSSCQIILYAGTEKISYVGQCDDRKTSYWRQIQ